jgi:hypothetical protein
MSSTMSAESHANFNMESESESWGQGKSRGTSISEGLSEVFISTIQWLPQHLWSLEEQWYRAKAEVMNLQRRQCYVRIEADRPFKTRTADLTPTYKSPAFKGEMLPRFLETTSRRSKYLALAKDVDQQIAARLDALLNPPARPAPPEPVTAPQPISENFPSDPIGFALDYWTARSRSPNASAPASKPATKSKKKPTRPRGRKQPAFTMIDGGKGGAGDNDDGGR